MDSLMNRYRSITLLLVVLVAQLIFLAYQVKTNDDVRLVRVWAVTAITPIAQVAETTRGAIYGVFHNYFDLHNAREDNRRMRAEVDKLKLENHYLKNELSTADRVKALAAFEKQTPSRLLAARIIANGTTSASKIVFLDRGSDSEVEKGMAVITPDGIVGVILDAYPRSSQALLATDPGFAAGVVSQKNHVRGILRGIGSGKCKVDMVQNEEQVDVGEEFFTSGDDRIFPRGLPVGKAGVVHDGSQFKDILVYPAGLQNGPEEVLIVLTGVHQRIPEHEDREDDPLYMGQPAPITKQAQQAGQPVLATDADRIVEHYKKIGALEGHKFGEGNAPNFNVPVPVETKPAVLGSAAGSVQGNAPAGTPAASARTTAPKMPAPKTPAPKTPAPKTPATVTPGTPPLDPTQPRPKMLKPVPSSLPTTIRSTPPAEQPASAEPAPAPQH